MNSFQPYRPQYHILVEGNIAVGKSTFVKRLEHKLGLNAKVFTEPLDHWINFNGTNLLQEAYLNPSSCSFRFQTFVQLSIGVIQYQQVHQPIKIMERSLGSGRYVFTEALKVKGHLTQTEYDILNEWQQWLIQISPHTDEIVYLRASPETVLKRLKVRNRDEESGVDIEYLRLLHELHERWLISDEILSPPVRVIDMDQSLESTNEAADNLAQELTDKIFPHLLLQ